MADITYEALTAARAATKADTQEMDIMSMANVALNILEQVNQIKGNAGGIMQSRPPEGQTQQQKPVIDADQIIGALNTIKGLKGDIKITELETLIKQHKDQVTMLLGKL